MPQTRRPARSAKPTTGRILGSDPGSEYTPLEVAYLRAVERFRQRVKFPTALDHFRLAREVLAGHPEGGGEPPANLRNAD